MKAVRQFLAAPFFLLAFLVFCVSVMVDLIGCAVVFFAKMAEGSQ